MTVIADRVQVLRDGNTSLVSDVAATDRPAMIEAMIGRRMAEVQRPPAPTHGFGLQPALAWRNASSGRAFSDVTLEVDARRGRGALRQARLGRGRGRRDRVRDPQSSTRAPSRSRASPPSLRQPTAAIGRGVGFLPADRKAGGAFMVRPVAENVAAASWSNMATLGWLSDSERGAARSSAGASALAHPLARRPEAGRWARCRAATSRRCCSPAGSSATHAPWCSSSRPAAWTSGRARTSTARCASLRGRDVAVLVVTSDYEEAVQVADRAVVMAKGRVVAGARQGPRSRPAGCSRPREASVADQELAGGSGRAAPEPLRDWRRVGRGSSRSARARSSDGRACRSPRPPRSSSSSSCSSSSSRSTSPFFLQRTRQHHQHLPERRPDRDRRLSGDAAADRRSVRPLGGLGRRVHGHGHGAPRRADPGLTQTAVRPWPSAVGSRCWSRSARRCWSGSSTRVGDGVPDQRAHHDAGDARDLPRPHEGPRQEPDDPRSRLRRPGGRRASLGHSIPIPVFIFAAVVIVFILILRYTTYGRSMYAIGASPTAARLAGIRTNRGDLHRLHPVGASLAGLSGLILVSQVGGASVVAGDGPRARGRHGGRPRWREPVGRTRRHPRDHPRGADRGRARERPRPAAHPVVLDRGRRRHPAPGGGRLRPGATCA